MTEQNQEQAKRVVEVATTLLQAALNLRKFADSGDEGYQLFIACLPKEFSDLLLQIRTASRYLPTVEEHNRAIRTVILSSQVSSNETQSCPFPECQARQCPNQEDCDEH